MPRSLSVALMAVLLLLSAGCASVWVLKKAHDGDLAAVDGYLANGGSVRDRFSDGGCDDCTLLHAAADGGQADLVRVLLDRGADANAIGGHGRTPLHYAAGGQSAEVARLLISHGARATISNRDEWGSTPLLIAAASVWQPDWSSDRAVEPSAELIEVLLEGGADVNAPSTKGNTPLHIAAYKGFAGTVRLLLARGANRTARNTQGETPEALAQRFHQDAVVAILRAP